jgi:hypothetical protein
MTRVRTIPDVLGARSAPATEAWRLVAAALVFAVVLLPGSAFAITRSTVLSRAQVWADSPVPYSQARYNRGYRTDCSGYVSACWDSGTSYSTRSFHLVTHSIAASQLQPGDAMLKKGYHIRLFYGWLDASHKEYVAYEAGDVVAVTRIHSMAEDLRFGYVPTRYDRISGTLPPSSNLLRNGTFNTWVRDWGASAARPVWWDIEGPGWGSFTTRRKDVFHGARNSLQLVNPSADPDSYTEMSQAASITAGLSYQFKAWARAVVTTPTLEMQVECLDASGNLVSRSGTTGEDWSICALGFRPMSITFTPPPGAARAVATLRLGGGAIGEGTSTVPGTSVLIDDVTLVRPQAAVTIEGKKATSPSGEAGVLLSGSVAPTSAIGQKVVVCVRKPSGKWEERTGTIAADAGAAVWRFAFRLRRGAPAGNYSFKVRVPTAPAYLGAESKVISFTLP